MPWKIQPIRGQDYQCIFCGMQRVVFHSTFSSLLARNSLLRSIWGLIKSQLRNSSTPVFKPLRTFSDHIRKFSEDFGTLPKISKDFPKNLKNHKNIWKLLLNRFQSFPKIYKLSEHLELKISEDFPKIKKKHKNIWKLLLNRFHSFLKISKASWTLMKISEDFLRILKIT